MPAEVSGQVAFVREFNRFYTRHIGLLQEGLLESPFSLTEARTLYELAHRAEFTASELADLLGLDRGYLSRIVRQFEARGFVKKKRSPADGRRQLLTLTDKGNRTFAPIDALANEHISGLLSGLSTAETQNLLDAMRTMRRLLDPAELRARAYVLRPPEPGDYGWVVSAHGELYAKEYGWDAEIEALAAEVVASFVRGHDAKSDRCWIAEADGVPVGCIFVMRESKTVAKLRLLLVAPSARGLGIGSRLVAEAIGFARKAGYRRMTLWTQSMLKDARGLYRRAGFELRQQERHRHFGQKLVGESWELRL
jgi:DNA-binding MarR family transcriptional regulator/N-acetylglutamate synthase-like GNAT family acetyltransferase